MVGCTGSEGIAARITRRRKARDAVAGEKTSAPEAKVSADDEPELDPAAPIASLSLGAPRDFRLRPRPSPRRPPGLAVPRGYGLPPTAGASDCVPFTL